MKSITKVLLLTALALGTLQLQAQDKKETEKNAIEQLVLKHSGFMKDDEIIIRFNKEDQEIVGVTDKGEVIPEKNFYKYEPMLMNYLEARALKDIGPELSRLREDLRHSAEIKAEHRASLQVLKRNMDSLRERQSELGLPSIERIREMEEFRSQLLQLEVTEQIKRRQKEISEMIKRRKADIKEAVNALYEAKLIPAKKDVTIKFSKGKCWVNGDQLSEFKTQEFITIWEEHMDSVIDTDSNKFIIEL